jgi:hypothetical protein
VANSPSQTDVTVLCTPLELPRWILDSPRGTLTWASVGQYWAPRTPLTAPSGFGGFPGPFQLFQRGFAWAFPRTKQRITRTLTMNLDRRAVHGKDVPYIDFDAVVGRNSTFVNLTEEQLEVLGGAEYIALKFLLKVVAGVSISSVELSPEE